MKLAAVGCMTLLLWVSTSAPVPTAMFFLGQLSTLLLFGVSAPSARHHNHPPAGDVHRPRSATRPPQVASSGGTFSRADLEGEARSARDTVDDWGGRWWN